MILSFSDSETELLFQSEASISYHSFERTALRKLIQVNSAGSLRDLAVPPGNRLEALHGNLSGWHSIRVNDQFRIVFRWTPEGPAMVRITDYH